MIDEGCLYERKNKFLIISRVGDESLHKTWINPVEYKNFDLILEYYGDKKEVYKDDCDLYLENNGVKFPRIFEIIQQYKEHIFKYEAICILDDDLLTDAENLSNMFRIFNEHNIFIGQPALSLDSYYSHPITLENHNFKFRYTNFVEIMAPIFSKEALMMCWQTFNINISGWGLDLLWPKLVEETNKRMAIIDATPVKHTRPLGVGGLYKTLNQQHKKELESILTTFNIKLPYEYKFLGGELKEDSAVVSCDKSLMISKLLQGTSGSLLKDVNFCMNHLIPIITNYLEE